jgi:hypothetical protein
VCHNAAASPSLADRSPRLQRCIDAAVAAGADEAWLQDKYATMRGHHMHHIFRTLCCAGPGAHARGGRACAPLCTW